MTEGLYSASAGKRKAVATHGINYTYVCDVFAGADRPEIFRVGVPFPFPEQLCCGCGHEVMGARAKFEKNVKQVKRV